MFQSGLQEFLQDLPQKDLLEIDERIPRDEFLTSLVLEMENRQDYRVVKLNQVEGNQLPVVANLFSTRERIARMFGTTRENFYLKWHEAQERFIEPITVEGGPVQDVVLCGEDVDVGMLPIALHFSSDAGRYISSGIVVAKDPDTGVYNLSYHRMQLKGKNTFGISLHSRGHLWDYFRRSKEKNRDLEIAVIIGCAPSVYLAASTKMGIDRNEYALAGALMGEALELVKCRTVDLEVPASAEIVLEGRISIDNYEDEGPFGEYTGYSTGRSTRNMFYVSAMTRRKNAVYLDLIPGFSNEHLLLGGAAKEAENLYRIKEVYPSVQDICFPKSGCHFHAYVKMKKTAKGQALNVMTMLCGLDMYLKTIIAVDEDIDIYREEEVLWAAATRMQPDQQVIILPRLMCNVLDPSSEDGMSSKLLIDATQPMNKELHLCKQSEEVRQQVIRLLSR